MITYSGMILILFLNNDTYLHFMAFLACDCVECEALLITFLVLYHIHTRIKILWLFRILITISIYFYFPPSL